MISIDEQSGAILLSTISTSYALTLVEHAYPSHVHWGNRIGSNPGPMKTRMERRPFSVQTPVRGAYVALGSCPSEYGWWGPGDYRVPAWEAVDSQGFPIVEPWYERHSILQGKPPLDGLPSSFTRDGDGAETLELVLHDEPSG